MPPYLANLFAYHAENPEELAVVERRMKNDGFYDIVPSPAPGWVAATRALPRSPQLPGPVAQGPVIFAEGSEILAGDHHAAEVRLSELIKCLGTPERLGKFEGDFGFVFLEEGGKATAVRSCAGPVPFYTYRSAHRVAVGTRLGDFARYLPEEPVLNPFVNAVWTSRFPCFPDGQSFLENVFMVAAGGFERLSRNSRTGGLYWRPVPREVRPSSAAELGERAELFRAQLTANLSRDLDPDGLNLLSLSGGVDSSSLAALASRTHRLATVSLVPQDEEFRKRDLSYIEPLVERYGFQESVIFTYDDAGAPARLKNAPPVAAHVMHPVLLLLPELAGRLPISVYFGGEYADPLWGSHLTFPDWVMAVSLPRLLAKGWARQLPNGRRDFARWVKQRTYEVAGRPRLPFAPELPGFIEGSLRQRYLDWIADQERRAKKIFPAKRWLALRLEGDGCIPMNWEATTAVGIRRSFPFFGREMVELAMGTHPEDLIGPGPKKLPRLALASQIPSRNLYRPDKGRALREPRPQVQWTEQVPCELEPILEPGLIPHPPCALPWDDARAIGQLIQIDRALKIIRS